MVSNSPTSINIYNQCPRLYYYQYIERKPSFPHIDLIKGKAIHETLEEFFKIDNIEWKYNFSQWIRTRAKTLLIKNWKERFSEFKKIGMSEPEIENQYQDCLAMINNWVELFLKRINSTKKNPNESFKEIKRLTEKRFYLEKYEITAIIDLIENNDDEITIIDYKTSSKFEITKEYKLQLSIYAYLYKEIEKKVPTKVGINFLKERIHLISVDEAMLKYAERECKKIYELTQSKNISDYPQNEGYLCRSLGGKCPCHKYE